LLRTRQMDWTLGLSAVIAVAVRRRNRRSPSGMGRLAVVAEREMDVAGLPPSESREQLGIDAKLRHMPGARRTGELGVERLVALRPEVGLLVDPDQEVREAVPGDNAPRPPDRHLGNRLPALNPGRGSDVGSANLVGRCCAANMSGGTVAL
jgi:hypothetical protein